MATVSELATRAGRPKGAVRFAPRNALGLGAKAAGTARAPYEGNTDQVAADVKRARDLDCDWLTFDMPNTDVAGMIDVMERFIRDVKPQAG